MGNFRELIGRDLPSSLEADYYERPIDRIGAFSKGNRLGTLLWRIKYGKDLSCFKPAALLLAKETQLQTPIGYRVCELAISEWLLPECETCRGAREVIFGPKRIVCPSCEGYGVKRYENWERSRFIGSSFKPWVRRYGKVCDELTAKARSINPTMSAELER